MQRQRLTNVARSLDTAKDTTSTHPRDDLHESQPRQHNTSSRQDCTLTALNTYLGNEEMNLRTQFLIPILSSFKWTTVPHVASQTSRNTSNRSNLSAAENLQQYAGHRERNHLSKEKEPSIGELRTTTVLYTQSNSRIRCTYRLSPTVCYVHSIGVKFRTITFHSETEHGKLHTPTG